MRFRNFFSLYLLAALTASSLSIHIAQAQSIPADRLTDWSAVGLENTGVLYSEMVEASTYGAQADGVTDDAPSIQAAIDALAGPGMVLLDAGTYRLESTLIFPSWVILKGSGAQETILAFDLGGAAENCIEAVGSVTSSYTDILSVADLGASFVTVADPTDFSVGSHVELVEDNGSWDSSPAGWAAESVGHLSKIVSISGSTIELANPLRIALDSSLSPRIRTYDPIEGVGVECLQMQRLDSVVSGTAYANFFSYANNCWVASVESYKSVGSHVMISASKHVAVQGCYFNDSWAFNGVNTRGYGVTLVRHSSDCLVENNVFEHLRHAMMVKQGASGNVFGYNYSISPNRSEPGSTYSGDISLHGHYPFANLFEGNIVQNIMTDDYWGPAGPNNTFFRNRIELFGLIMSSAESNLQNYVGNEIPNTDALLGNYVLTGTDHFEAGNWVQGNLTPASTTVTTNSHYLDATPDFWNTGESWPSIGNSTGEGSNPARERFVNGIEWSYHGSANCPPPVNLGADALENFSFAFELYPNPASQFIHLKSEENVTAVRLFSIDGKIVRNYGQLPADGLLWLNGSAFPDQLAPGIYCLQAIVEGKSVQRLLEVH